MATKKTTFKVAVWLQKRPLLRWQFGYKKVTISSDQPKALKAITENTVIKKGEQVHLSVEANDGYEFVEWQIEGQAIGQEALMQYTIEDDADIKAVFKVVVADLFYEATTQYNAVGGEVSVPEVIQHGKKVEFNILPKEGYKIESILLGAKDVKDELTDTNEGFKYTSEQVTGDISINVRFVIKQYTLSLEYADSIAQIMYRGTNSYFLKESVNDYNYETAMTINILNGNDLESIYVNDVDMTDQAIKDSIKTNHVYHYSVLPITENIHIVLEFKSAKSIGVQEENKNKITLYPNPVKTSFTLQNVQKRSILKLNTSVGKTVLETVYTGEQIDISHLAPGVYTLMISNENRIQMEQLIRE